MKKLLEKYLLFIIGLYFLATGIVLILRSTLGTTPISSINYVLSLNTSFSLGTWTFLINLLLIAGQFWFVRDCLNRRDTIEILLQIPFSFLFEPNSCNTAHSLHNGHYPAIGRLPCTSHRCSAGNKTQSGHDERRGFCQLRCPTVQQRLWEVEGTIRHLARNIGISAFVASRTQSRRDT